MELKWITITLDGVSMLTAASTSAHPTGSLISGLVNNSSRDKLNDPDIMITNTEDEFIAETDVGPNHYQVMTCSHNVGASDMTRCGVVNTADAVLLSDHAGYPGIPLNSHIRRQYRNKDTTEHDALKSQSAAGASTRLRPVSATRRMPVGRYLC